MSYLSYKDDDEEVLALWGSQAEEQRAQCVDQVTLLLSLHSGDAQNNGH